MSSSGVFELLSITGGTGAVRSTDVLCLVDVADATQAAQGSLVKITLAQLYRTETTAVTVSTPLPDIAQKWNAGGVTFTAVKLNVTDTASAAGSLLLDLQVAAASKWSVTKAGAVVQASSLTVSANGITVTGNSTITGTLGSLTGLTVASGTTAVQALTATTGAFSSTVTAVSTVTVGSASLFGNRGLSVSHTTLTGVAQYGVVSNGVFSSAATTSGSAFYSQVATAVAAYTMPDAYGYYVEDAFKGAGSAITRLHGVYVASQTGGVTNYAIYTNTGPISLGDGVTIRTGGLAVTGTTALAALTATTGAFSSTLSSGPTAPAANRALNLDVTLSGSVTQIGLKVAPTFGTDATTGAFGHFISMTGTAGAYTTLQVDGVFIGDYIKGAGSTVTTQYGLRIDSQTQGATNWAIYCDSGTTSGGVTFRTTALATAATVGHLFIPSCAGAPTGVPASIPTGQVALQYDSTNNQIYIYNGAWKKTVALT